MSLTSVIRYVQALDTSATDGSGKTGLAFGDITAKYLVHGGTLTSLTTETITTLGTYQAPTSAAHVRIKELAGSDPTKGIYEVHFHNTPMAGSGKKLWLFLSASGARFQPLEVDLVPFMNLDAQSASDLKDFADAGYDPVEHEVFSLSATAEANIADAVRAEMDSDSTQLAAILTAIGNLNNLSALANLYGPSVMEIPDSGTVQYPLTLAVRDAEGKLVDLDLTPSLSAANAAGTDRSGNLSAPVHASTGVYTFHYSVSAAAASEGLRIAATGAVSSEARRADFACAVADYDSVTMIAAILADTNELQADWANGGRLDNILDARASQSSVDVVDGNVDLILEDTGTTLPALFPSSVYHAEVDLTIDGANSQDEYTVRWFKDAVAVNSGITSPTISVIKRSDGAALVSAQTMTQVGSTGAYKYDAVSAERQTAGEAVEVVVAATIDAATRTWKVPLGRDSAAP